VQLARRQEREAQNSPPSRRVAGTGKNNQGERPALRRRWGYVQEELNALGEQGYELVHATGGVAVFCRRVQPVEQQQIQNAPTAPELVTSTR
jgi:hypothetical protein